MFPADQAGRALARFLTKPRHQPAEVSTSAPNALAATIQPGDVLLVEGDTRISVAIKYLTQSSWSHAALCIGNVLGPPPLRGEPHTLLEADVTEGVRAVPLSMYASRHTRICRPVGLRPDEIDRIISHAVAQLGHRYDMKHIWDLARYLLPQPPVPARWRRRLLAVGSGDPTRAICSTLIAESFLGVNYPILPEAILARPGQPEFAYSYEEALHIHKYGLYVPRDFDVSPYFQIVKPTLVQGFDPHAKELPDATLTS